MLIKTRNKWNNIHLCLLKLEMNKRIYIFVYETWDEWKNIHLCSWMFIRNILFMEKGDENQRGTIRTLPKMVKTMNKEECS